MRLKLKENPRDWRNFTLAAGAALTLAGGLAWRRQMVGGVALLGWLCVAGLVGVLACLRPGWFRGFYRVGMTVGFHLGQKVGWVLLVVTFVFVVTPLGWLLRALGKDLLRLRRDAGARTYWQPAKPSSPLDRMF